MVIGKFVKLFISLAVMAGIFFIIKVRFLKSYKHTYYYSADKSKVVTKVRIESWDNGADVYFTPGKFNSNNIPNSYIKPHSKGVSGDWSIYFFFDSSGVTFLGGICDTAKLNSHFKYYSLSVTNYSKGKPVDSLMKVYSASKSGDSYAVYD